MKIDNLALLDRNGFYSYADYLHWTFNEIVELIKGKIFPMSAPHWQHQQVASNFHGLLWHYLKGKPCKIFPAPFDVRFLDKGKSSEDKQIFTVVQPDLSIICNTEIINKTGCIGSPDAIIEIVSPSTAEKDVKIKFALYEENLVKEYWIAYPKEQILWVYDLINEKYELRKIYTIDDKVQMKVLGDCWINLDEIFERTDD